MGWTFNWASSDCADLGADLGFSATLQDSPAANGTEVDGSPAVAFRNAEASGTDVHGCLTGLFGFTAFAREGEPCIRRT